MDGAVDGLGALATAIVPGSSYGGRSPARRVIQLDLFKPVAPLEELLSDPGVMKWQEIGGIAPPMVVNIVQDIARRGVRRRDVAVRAAWSQPELSNVTRGRFGASPARARALVESLRDLVAA